MRRSIALFLALGPAVAWAAPLQLTHQGRLADVAGAPLTGTHTVRLSLFTAPSGGSVLFTEEFTVDLGDDGFFSVILGSDTIGNPLDDEVFDQPKVYVGMAIDGGAPLVGRHEITSVPFAIQAAVAGSVRGGVVDATEVRVDGDVVIDDRGRLVGEGTLTGLDCANNQIPLFDGLDWVCDDAPSSIARLECGANQLPLYNGATWVCAAAPSGIASLSCATNQIALFNGSSWVCAAVPDVTESRIEGLITNGPLSLHASTTLAGQAIATGPHTTTLPWSAITDVPSGVAVTESQVETWVVNGPLVLNPATTLGGTAISTGPHTTSLPWSAITSVPQGVFLTEPQVEDWVENGPLDLHSGTTLGLQPIATGPHLTESQVESFITNGAINLAPGSTVGGLTVATVRDTTPATFAFTALTGQLPDVAVVSADVPVSGFDGSLVVSVVGQGDPLLRVNGGPWRPAGKVQAGDELELTMRTSRAAGTRIASVILGDNVAHWSVTASAPKATCKSILAADATRTDGTYVIDTDLTGPRQPFDVYCDMTGGGWTWAAKDTQFRFEFTGAPEMLVTPAESTEYQMTAYGGAGGTGITSDGGWGGMARGNKVFSAATTLWVLVGGQGGRAGPADVQGYSSRLGGWNGGGRGTQGGSGGGGATDVRTALGDLATRILVAGGGGGCAYGGSPCQVRGGHGGGLVGENGPASPQGSGGGGGTQSAGGVASYNSGANPGPNGVFGLGGDNYQGNDEGGGGGGWYGGAAGGRDNETGGGGSSYYDGMTSNRATSPGVNPGAGYLDYIFK